MNDIKYIIKPEDGMVIGIMEDVKNIHNEIVANEKYKLLDEVLYIKAFNIGEKYPDKIKATARVKDGDKFDEVTGKRIVEKKLYRKLHERLARQYSQLQDVINELSIITSNMESIHIDKAIKINEDYIKKYVDKEAE